MISSMDEKYIIEPFTIDGSRSKTLDDAFSITCDCFGQIFLNIHIALISNVYLKRGYDFSTIVKETTSVRITDYIGKNNIHNYSLIKGVKEVLTLKISPFERKSFSICEKVEIVNNYVYEHHVDPLFYQYVDIIFGKKDDENSHRLVNNLMGYYSASLSRYLFNNGFAYIVGNNLFEGPDFKRGSFTSPLRSQQCLLNQFIFLQAINKKLKHPLNEPVILNQLSNDMSFDKPKEKRLSLYGRY